MTTVGLPDTLTYATVELASCLVTPSALPTDQKSNTLPLPAPGPITYCFAEHEEDAGPLGATEHGRGDEGDARHRQGECQLRAQRDHLAEDCRSSAAMPTGAR